MPIFAGLATLLDHVFEQRLRELACLKEALVPLIRPDGRVCLGIHGPHRPGVVAQTDE